MKQLTFNTYFFDIIEIAKEDNKFLGISFFDKIAVLTKFRVLIL